MVRLTDRPEMTLDVYRGRKTTIQQQQQQQFVSKGELMVPNIHAHYNYAVVCLGYGSPRG